MHPPEHVYKTIHRVRSSFLAHSPCLRVRVNDVCAFSSFILLFQEMQIRCNKTLQPMHVSFVLFSCPRRSVVFAHSGLASFLLRVFSGFVFWPRAFFGFARNIARFELARPLRGPFLRCEAVRVFASFFGCFCCSLSTVFAASHVSLAARPTARPVAGLGVRSTSCFWHSGQRSA